jgi:ankyrin repeat protein
MRDLNLQSPSIAAQKWPLFRGRLSTGGGQEQDDSVEIKSTKIALSDCIFGEIPAVLRFPRTSRESHILIHGKDDGGNTVLSFAAAEKHPEIVYLPLENGSNVNSRNVRGRIPLMEAALWGRAENARILLQNGADNALKDRAGYTASDFAVPHTRNEEERSRECLVANQQLSQTYLPHLALGILLSISIHSTSHPQHPPSPSLHRSLYSLFPDRAKPLRGLREATLSRLSMR